MGYYFVWNAESKQKTSDSGKIVKNEELRVMSYEWLCFVNILIKLFLPYPIFSGYFVAIRFGKVDKFI